MREYINDNGRRYIANGSDNQDGDFLLESITNTTFEPVTLPVTPEGFAYFLKSIDLCFETSLLFHAAPRHAKIIDKIGLSFNHEQSIPAAFALFNAFHSVSKVLQDIPNTDETTEMQRNPQGWKLAGKIINAGKSRFYKLSYGFHLFVIGKDQPIGSHITPFVRDERHTIFIIQTDSYPVKFKLVFFVREKTHLFLSRFYLSDFATKNLGSLF